MSFAVVGETSLIECCFGTAPTPLTVLPDRTVMAEGMLMGNITDSARKHYGFYSVHFPCQS